MIIDDPEVLYRRPLQGGVYQVDATARPEEPAVITERLAEAGWPTTTLGPITDLDGFYAEIAAGLGFPHYFGANLDALWDALRSIRTATAVIIDWREFAAAEPSRSERILAVLEQRSDRLPPFAVVLT